MGLHDMLHRQYRDRRTPAVVCNAGFEAWLRGYSAK
jgi:hypothetical protein